MSPTTPPPDTSVKVAHLVLGLLFLGTAVSWALVATGAVDTGALPYLGPGLLVAAGAVGLVASLLGSRRVHDQPDHDRPDHDRPDHDQPAPDHPSVTMEDQPAPGSTRRLEQQDPYTAHDGEPTAPLHRPEDHR